MTDNKINTITLKFYLDPYESFELIKYYSICSPAYKIKRLVNLKSKNYFWNFYFFVTVFFKTIEFIFTDVSYKVTI